METDRQMTNMLLAAKNKLKKHTPEEISRSAEVVFDEDHQTFRIKNFNRVLFLKYPDYEPAGPMEMWNLLTILQYLDTADGTPLSGKWVSLTELPGGDSRGEGFNRDIEAVLQKNHSGLSAEQFRELCLEAGGIPAEGKGDFCCIICFAPRFPVMINFWEADDEFPASVRVYVDAQADHYLTLEGAGTACVCVINAVLGYDGLY